MTRDHGTRLVAAVDTSCDILTALGELDGAGVTELATEVDVSKATVHSHLATLKANEFVVQEGTQYFLSHRFLEFGEFAKDRIGIYSIVTAEVEDLATETGELVQFATEEFGRVIYLYKARGENAVQTASRIGRRQYLHCTALGKAILSQYDDDRVDAIVDEHGLPEMTPHTITSRESLFEDLVATRDRGYAIDDQEAISGLRCIAAPVVGPDESVRGAVSISGPSGRMRGERFEETIPEHVIGATNAIELNAKFQ